MRDFGFEDESDVFMKNGDRVGPALRKTSESKGANGGSDGGEVTGGDIEGAVVVAYKKVQHAVAHAASHCFNKLVSEGQDSRVANSDGIEGCKSCTRQREPFFFATQNQRDW